MSFTAGTAAKRLAGIAGATCLAALAFAGPAAALNPTGDYADFKYCPVNHNPHVDRCVYSTTTSGAFKFGNQTVPINKTIVLQGGYIVDPNTFANTWVDAEGADTLVKTPLDVPGGLTGIMSPNLFPPPLQAAFNHAVNTVNGVTATAEKVGPIQFSLNNFLGQTGTTLQLPVRVHLENPFLGPNCYIGSSSNPITLKLTTGTTAPPRPNTPISGDRGLTTFKNGTDLIITDKYKLVDNAFSVPAASGCGYTPFDQPFVTAAVNLKVGLPAAAGKNSAILQGGQFKQAARDAVVASSH